MSSESAMEARAVFAMDATVSEAGHLDLNVHNSHVVGFVRTREAMTQIRDELDRILREGEMRCPFSARRRRAEAPERDAAQA
jgi:hypothetical protein